jgi:hypothetical protein
MAHYAQVIDGIVQQVLVIEQDVIDTGLFGDPSQWIQTSYNTRAGEHLLGGTPLRKNFAGIGSIYDAERDAFYTPQPYPSWIFDENTCVWFPPTPMPEDGKYYNWDESTTSWVEITL